MIFTHNLTLPGTDRYTAVGKCDHGCDHAAIVHIDVHTAQGVGQTQALRKLDLRKFCPPQINVNDPPHSDKC